MAQRKRLQKVGGTTQAILLTKDLQALLGLENGDTIIMEVAGDMLLVQRDGADPVDPAAVVEAIDGLQDAPDTPFRKVEGGLWGYKKRIVEALRDRGPLRRKEIADAIGARTEGLGTALSGLQEDGFIVREGWHYRLVED